MAYVKSFNVSDTYILKSRTPTAVQFYIVITDKIRDLFNTFATISIEKEEHGISNPINHTE
jgi:hypothetical protein